MNFAKYLWKAASPHLNVSISTWQQFICWLNTLDYTFWMRVLQTLFNWPTSVGRGLQHKHINCPAHSHVIQRKWIWRWCNIDLYLPWHHFCSSSLCSDYFPHVFAMQLKCTLFFALEPTENSLGHLPLTAFSGHSSLSYVSILLSYVEIWYYISTSIFHMLRGCMCWMY